ncbi:hybrid sensor histidine kinase/response regulator [Paraliomyxa miuraensis]|uniref:hybrid sensor histidine kinase/response regulator n=1 Tax=Paraliomyxa miuraensis TaxID=376150 RepID=UPI00225B788E|nr:ATP-binding protein [Paraliomyxa miuraensis]MCX4241994.1 ATP-binding protein [Paraliomyxa miuraensis]
MTADRHSSPGMDFFAGPGVARALCRAIDWSTTSLGSVDQWPAALHTSTLLCLEHGSPMALWLGPELALIHNDAYAPLLGSRSPAAMGLPMREGWPEALDALGRRCEELVRPGQAPNWEHHVDATARHVLTPIRASDGRVLGVLDLVEPSTPGSHAALGAETARELEVRQTFLLRLTDAIGPNADPRDAQHAVTRLLGEYLGASRVCYAEVDDDDDTIRIHAAFCAPGIASPVGVYHVHAFGPYLLRTLGSGHTLVISDVDTVTELSEQERTSYPTAGVIAYLGVPLVRNARLVAFLAIHQSAPRVWTPEEIGLAEEIAARTWAAVERARAEAALRISEERLREADRRKDEFLAMLGHELRNPLAAIRNATALIEHTTSPDPRMTRIHAVLERQSTHMTHLIDGLLEVSRIARGKIVLERTTLDACSVVEEVVHDHGSELEERQLELETELPAAPLWVLADRARLVQIFDNIVGNAIKFTPACGRVVVTLTAKDGAAVFRVRDTGVGMRPEMLEVLFEPFQQEAQDIVRSAGGLGLGLALAKGLVALHDGAIEARSAGLGEGTELVVRLPLAPPPDVDAPRPRPNPSKPRHILIVEDNADARTMLAMLLELQGHAVALAETGLEALELLQRHSFDLILCDLGLPGMSGYDVAKAIRSDPKTRDTPLVAVTGYGQPSDRARTLDAGFDEHLVKPAGIEAIAAVLERYRDGRG